jgi:hypothetical protein
MPSPAPVSTISSCPARPTRLTDGRGQADAIFVILDFLGNTDPHVTLLIPLAKSYPIRARRWFENMAPMSSSQCDCANAGVTRKWMRDGPDRSEDSATACERLHADQRGARHPVGLSASAAHRRVKALEQAGAIIGYRARLSRAAVAIRRPCSCR